MGYGGVVGMVPDHEKLTKHINMLPDDLVGSLGPGIVLVLHLHGIRWGRKKGDMHIQIVGLLDGPHNLFFSMGIKCVAAPCRTSIGPPQWIPDMAKPHISQYLLATTC
jgi:hypothetical protein